MNKFEFAECISQIDQSFIEEAQPPLLDQDEQVAVRTKKTPWALIAACLCLLIALPIGLMAGLRSKNTQSLTTPSESTTEQLPSEEILAFTARYNETEPGEAMQVSGQSLPAIDSQTPQIDLDQYDPNEYHNWQSAADGTRRYGYRFDYECDTSWICCYEGETLVWESEAIDFSISELAVLDFGIAIVGAHSYIGDYGTETDYYFQIFDYNGQPLWEKKTAPDWSESMAFVENENGSLSVFIAAEDSEIRALRYSAEGEELSKQLITQVQAYCIVDAEATDGGYVLVVDTMPESYMGESYVVFLKEDGTLLEYWRYSNDTDDMRVTNALWSDNWLYVSGYLIHNQKESFLHYESSALCVQLKEELQDNLWADTSSGGNVTQQGRAYYTAILLKIDVLSGEIVTFYTTPGALGADVRLAEDGTLCWQQENIGSMSYILTSLIGICEQINYRFEDGCFKPEKTQIFTELFRNAT